MIAGHENGRAPEGAPTVTTQRASVAIAKTEPSVFRPLSATPPYTDENDPTDEEVLPLSYDDRRDYYSSGRYSVDCAPEIPEPQSDAGYFVDSELEPPRVGDPCVSCMGKPKVAGCMCVSDARTAYLALPNELAPPSPPLSVWTVRRKLAVAFRGNPLLRTVAQGPASGDTISTCAWGECGREYIQKNGWGSFCSKACGIAEMSA